MLLCNLMNVIKRVFVINLFLYSFGNFCCEHICRPVALTSFFRTLIFHCTNSKEEAIAILNEGVKSKLSLAKSQEEKDELLRLQYQQPVPGRFDHVFFRYIDPQDVQKDKNIPGLYWDGSNPVVALKVDPDKVYVHNMEFRVRGDIWGRKLDDISHDVHKQLCGYNASKMLLSDYIKKRQDANKLIDATKYTIVYHPMSAIPEAVNWDDWRTKNELWNYSNEITFEDQIPANQLAR